VRKNEILLPFHFDKSLLENREKLGLFYIQLSKDFRIFTADIPNMAKNRSVTGVYPEMVAFWNEHSPHIQKNSMPVNVQSAPIISLNKNVIELSRCNKNFRNKFVFFQV